MIPGDVPQWIVLVWLFVLGSVIGSFLNVCIYRLPHHERLWAQLVGLTHPPSSCPYCKNCIQGRDNIPVLGWLILRGRCRRCRHSIPPRYALIEFFNGLLWVALYMAIVPAGYGANASDSCLWSAIGPLANPMLTHDQIVFLLHAQYFYFLVLAEALLVATFIDFDLQIIPDGATVPALIVGVLGAFAIGNLHLWPVWFQSSSTLQTLQHVTPPWMHWMMRGPDRPAWLAAHPHLHGLLSSLAGMVVGGGVIWVLRIVGHWAWRREVMGFGDVILMAMIGSFLGWQPTLLVFFVAPFCGLLATVASLRLFRVREIPYGPYLSVGALLVLFAWRPYFSQFETWFALGPLILVQAVIMFVLLVASLLLVRYVKRLIGFPDADDNGFVDEWTSGDQLAFYANKERHHGCDEPKGSGWRGTATGQGRHYSDQWRRGGR
jgi:leader peptidase (prepilin peptidase)/N-methyltransferase